jgi:3-keto-5-aminohexanoate cleavage enzyme
MSNAVNKINWALIEEYKKKEDFKCIWNAYGLPEVTDPIHTAYATSDVDVQPRWKTWDKIPISTTITGAFYSKRANPNHPQTPEEIYKSAREACLAGAPIVHIHVRDKDGYNVLDPKLFHSVIDPLRKEFPKTVFDGCMVPFQAPRTGCMSNGLPSSRRHSRPASTRGCRSCWTSTWTPRRTSSR